MKTKRKSGQAKTNKAEYLKGYIEGFETGMDSCLLKLQKNDLLRLNRSDDYIMGYSCGWTKGNE